MAGGSMAALPKLDKEFLACASYMLPISHSSKNQWILKDKKGMIVYSLGSSIELSMAGTFEIKWIDPKTGIVIKEESVTVSGPVTFNSQRSEGVVAWFRPISDLHNRKQ
jgi:hypothetical protein